MNIIFHFLFNYLFASAIFGDVRNYIIIIFIFSILIDIDHLQYLLKVGRGVIKKRFGSEARTRFHEIYGLVLFSAVACAFYFFVEGQILLITITCLISHLAIDFMTGRSVPFNPYSKKEVFLHMSPCGYRNKVLFEAFSTVLLGVLFWLAAPNLLL